MIVPLMIWSARTEIDSQAWTSETSTPASSARTSATMSAGDGAEDRPGSDAEDRHEVDARGPADEGRDEHRPLDADVDDAGSLAHDAAQRGEGDRRRDAAG